MKNKKLIALVLVVLFGIFAAYRLWANWNHLNSQKNENEGMSAQVSVNVADIKKMKSDRVLTLVGALNAEQEVDIVAETSGKITSMNFELGQYKTKGSSIVNIDDKLKAIAYQTAKTNFEKTKKDFERTENLYKGGTASEQEYDNAKAAYQNAQDNLDQAEKQFSYTHVTTPINGYISSKYVELGSYVNIGSKIASVVDISSVKVNLSVSESNAYSIKTGDKAVITTDVYPGAEFTGRVSFVSPSGDASHNYPVEIKIPNNSKYQLKSGTFVTAVIELKGSTALYIPREALQGSVKEAKVYVAKDGIAKLKNVVLGASNDDNYLEVISGLSEGEKVVVSGQINLADGKAIKIINNN